MEKTTTVFCADPNGKIYIRKLTRHEDGTCPLSEAKDQGLENVVRETRKQKRFSVDNIEIVGEISYADKAEIINISANGVLVNVPKRMDIGKKYMLKICSKEKKIVLMASVVWSQLAGTQRTSMNQIIPIYTAGMEFKDISTGNRKILKELIRHIETLTEHRKCERVPFVEDILIDGTGWVRSGDISEEGIYISSLHALKKDSVVELTIPIKQEKLTVKAKVQFCDKMVGFGLRFIDLSEEQKTKIKELIKSTSLKEMPDY
jgi:Tfp pilus assembly protein PilZ